MLLPNIWVNFKMKEYGHYYKKVPCEYIDVYRVLELFDVTDPCIQHAIKKLLVAGGRGHKNIEKDVREAIVSLNRRIDMWEEEKPKNAVFVDASGMSDSILTNDCTTLEDIEFVEYSTNSKVQNHSEK